MRFIVESARKGFGTVKPGHTQAANRRFGTTGDHHVGIVPHNQAGGVANGVRASRTRGHHRMVRPLEPVLDGNVTRDKIDQAGRNEKRAEAANVRIDRNRTFGNLSKAADTRSDHDASAALLFVGCGLPAGIFNRLGRRSHPVKDKGIDPPSVLGFHPFVWIEQPVGFIARRNLTADFRTDVRNIERLDSPNSGLARDQAFPTRFHPTSQGCEEPHTRNNNTFHNG